MGMRILSYIGANGTLFGITYFANEIRIHHSSKPDAAETPRVVRDAALNCVGRPANPCDDGVCKVPDFGRAREHYLRTFLEDFTILVLTSSCYLNKLHDCLGHSRKTVFMLKQII